ncbi:unnamed protein product, partial [Adineta steineri]
MKTSVRVNDWSQRYQTSESEPLRKYVA